MSHKLDALDDHVRLMDRVRASRDVTGATPFLYTEVLLSTQSGAKGLVLRGIDPESAGPVLTILNRMLQGGLEGLKEEGAPPGIIIGKELARRLGLSVGSRVNLLSHSGEKSSTGFAPRIRPFKVAGIFQTGMFEYDSTLGFAALPAVRELLGLPAGRLSGIELTVADLYQADAIAERLVKELGPPYYVRHWMEMNANLFAALKLEKIGMFLVLAMVVLIASFSIVTSLVMLVMEKTRDIAILMSMGATSGMIRRIFMLQGTIIGAVGTASGYALGITLALLLKEYQFIKLPQGVYALDHLPVLLSPLDIAIVGGSAMLLSFLATIYPARQAARLAPAEALRYE
jgi:lipoprotein-releasing system permease protein